MNIFSFTAHFDRTNLSNIETKKRDELLDELFRLQEKTGASIVQKSNPKYKND